VALSIGLCGSALASPSTQDPAKVPAGTYVLDKQHASLTVKKNYYQLSLQELQEEVSIKSLSS
jgi:polyisoprenoid-binding protein YceI